MNTEHSSRRLTGAFAASVLFMGFHKIESYFTGEWNTAPVYQAILGMQLEAGEMLFLSFVITLLAGLLCCLLIISLRSGTVYFLAFWGLTFLLEFHHLVRTLAGGHYYSGSLTAMAYIILGVFYWKELIRHFRTRGQKSSA